MRPRRARPTSPLPWAAPAPLPPARVIGSPQHEARQQGRPRDLIGYGEHPPHPRWPGGARVALQFVFNYEEEAERSVLDGDPHAEFLSEADAHVPRREGLCADARDRELPLTVFGMAQALARNPAVVEA